MNNNHEQMRTVPFGKYKGQPVEVLASDHNYLDWLNGQGWVKDKYPQFYTVIINNFQEPSDTPEHNALQAMFLDDEFCMKLINLIKPKTCDAVYKLRTKDSYRVLRRIRGKRFEYEGIDIHLHYDLWIRYQGRDGQWEWDDHTGKVAIEIKPSIGDDFPSVLRQAINMRSWDADKCTIYRDFVATSVSVDQVRAMFAHSNVALFSLSEIEQSSSCHYPDEESLKAIGLAP